jgi:hypothetical protein
LERTEEGKQPSNQRVFQTYRKEHTVQRVANGLTDSRYQDEITMIRKSLPVGNCEWPGYDSVWNRLQAIAHKMANGSHSSDEHLHTMAVLGSGHEETMKGWLMQMTLRGWKYDNVCPWTCKCPKHQGMKKYRYVITGRSHGTPGELTYRGNLRARSLRGAVVQALASEFGDPVKKTPRGQLSGWVSLVDLDSQLDCWVEGTNFVLENGDLQFIVELKGEK